MKKVTETTIKNKKYRATEDIKRHWLMVFLCRRIFNVCCPYGSRDEMTTAIKDTIELVKQGKITAEYSSNKYKVPIDGN